MYLRLWFWNDGIFCSMRWKIWYKLKNKVYLKWWNTTSHIKTERKCLLISSLMFTNGDTKYMSHLLYRFRGKVESSTGASIIYELLHSQHYEQLNEQVLWWNYKQLPKQGLGWQYEKLYEQVLGYNKEQFHEWVLYHGKIKNNLMNRYLGTVVTKGTI